MTIERTPAEWRSFRDTETGAWIRQWTGGSTMNHHLYFTNPSFSADARQGLFVSYRAGYPNLHAVDLASGEIVRITRRMDLNPFSPAASPREPAAYFSARDSVVKVDLETGNEELIASFPGAQLGICSLNPDGTVLAIGVRYPRHCELAIVDLADRHTAIACREEEVGHVQFCPLDDKLLLFSGPNGRRLWCHDRRTSKTWQVLREEPGEWLVHESWLGASRTIIYVRWPYALRSVEPDGGRCTELARVNAWHPRSDPSGRWIAFDTNHPDRGIQLFEVAGGRARTLCRSEATCRGSQWRHDVPAKTAGIDTSIIRSDRPELDPAPSPDDLETVYGPQWTHPHPSFSRNGGTVVFTSDRDRWSHVYAIEVSET